LVALFKGDKVMFVNTAFKLNGHLAVVSLLAHITDLGHISILGEKTGARVAFSKGLIGIEKF